MRVGLVGAGIMGHGMACNLLKAQHCVRVIAHRNRAPINDLVKRGAEEVPALKDLVEASDVVLLCVTGSAAVRDVLEAAPFSPGMMVIDCTTNAPDAPAQFAGMLAVKGVDYVEAPVTGGATQAKEGVLGAIVGCDEAVFDRAQSVLSAFCSKTERFGKAGMGAKAKLVSNFLALGTATLVIETFRQARDLDVDWRKLYDLVQLGSGNSAGLRRIMDAALDGDYGGYVFSVSNTAKDLGYFCDLVGEEGSDLAPVLRALHERAVREGAGELMLSELLAPDDPASDA